MRRRFEYPILLYAVGHATFPRNEGHLETTLADKKFLSVRHALEHGGHRLWHMPDCCRHDINEKRAASFATNSSTGCHSYSGVERISSREPVFELILNC